MGLRLHAAMDQTGAVLGPLLMVVTVARLTNFAPAFLRLAAPAAARVRGDAGGARWRIRDQGTPPTPQGTRSCRRVYWIYVAAAGLLACGFLDFPLLSYHFENTALVSKAVIPLLYAGAMGVNGDHRADLRAAVRQVRHRRARVGAILISMLSLPLGFLGGRRP